MSRWLWVWICAFLGLAMLGSGLLVPAHLRAVNAGVIALAGRSTPSLPDQGLALLSQNHLGAADLLFRAAQQGNVPGRGQFGAALTNLARQHPAWQVWGGGSYHLDVLFTTDPRLPKSGAEPFTDWVVRLENRGTVLELLRDSRGQAVRELLQSRSLTNTALIPPATSSSGQAFDAAVSICGLLLEERCLAPAMSNSVLALAIVANRGRDSARLEQMLLDFLSLGRRFNWGQLAAFVPKIQDPETLRLLASFVRNADTRLPVLFAAVQSSGDPAGVAAYLSRFSQTGLDDLGDSLRFNQGGLSELLRRNQRLFGLNTDASGVRHPAFILAWRTPRLALALKWLCFLGSGFFLALAAHFLRRAPSALERPLQVRGFHFAREGLFALGFLLVVLLLSEPFLTQDSQKVDLPFRLRLPTAGSLVPAASTSAHTTFMNQLSLLTLLLFFVLQALIYTACLVKLAEIRRQQLPSRVKLRLLENEDHLFDAGLYLGFVGTIISLILVSLGVIKPSLMAAYSSTSFGIIFVSIFKIFHLRPVRRKLLLETEANAEPATPAAARTIAASL